MDTGIRVLVFKTSGPFIESCHLSIKFNGFLDLETNGIVFLRDSILGEVAIDVECLFMRGTMVFVVMVVVMSTIRRVATVTIMVTLACLRRRTTASWRSTAGQAVVVVVIYIMGVMVTASSVLWVVIRTRRVLVAWTVWVAIGIAIGIPVAFIAAFPRLMVGTRTVISCRPAWLIVRLIAAVIIRTWIVVGTVRAIIGASAVIVVVRRLSFPLAVDVSWAACWRMNKIRGPLCHSS